MHAPPQSSPQATCTRACCRRRPGPQPGSTATTRAARVHLRGAAAGRRGWPPPCPPPRPGRPPPPPAASLPGRARRRQPGRGRPRRARQGKRARARRQDRAGARARRHPSLMGRASAAARSVWRLAGGGRALRRRFGSRRWGWWERAGRSGRSHGRWCAPGGGAPLGLACLAWVGDRHGHDPVGQPRPSRLIATRPAGVSIAPVLTTTSEPANVRIQRHARACRPTARWPGVHAPAAACGAPARPSPGRGRG